MTPQLIRRISATALASLVLFVASITGTARGGSLEVADGVVVKFSADGEIVVRDGLILDGGALFTSEMDDTALGPVNSTPATPARGDWLGVRLEASCSAASTRLDGLRIRYGGRRAFPLLTLRGTSFPLTGVVAEDGAAIALLATDGASSPISQVALRRASVGVQVEAGATPTITDAVLEGNGTGALATPPSMLPATDSWWGHPTGPIPLGLGNSASDGVTYQPFATLVPLFGLGVSLPDGDVSEMRDIELELRAPTAASYRISEDSTFAGVAFQDLTDKRLFTLSEGEGQKTLYVEFKAATGNSSTITRDLRLDTRGPDIVFLAPLDGATVSRPAAVSAAATDSAGVARVEFYADGILIGTATEAPYSVPWDMRALAAGAHDLTARATDRVGHESRTTIRVIVDPRPPDAPVINSPTNGYVTGLATVDVFGTAEPGVSVTLRRDSTTLGRVDAAVDGSFGFPLTPLIEGVNAITAVASDQVGSSPASVVVSMIRDSGPPTAPSLTAIAQPGRQVQLLPLAGAGPPPVSYRIYRSSAAFEDPTTATLVADRWPGGTFTDNPSLDGTYYYRASALNAVGVEGPLSGPSVVAVDGTPPTAVVVATPAGPVGVGRVVFSVTTSKPAASLPHLGITPSGGTTSPIELSPRADGTWSGHFDVTAATPSGTATLSFKVTDAAGNVGTLITSGSTLAIDTAGPRGALVLSPAGPVGPSNVEVALALDEPAASEPLLQFLPPTGSPLAIPLTGAGTAWSGTLTVSAGMGDGAGHFQLDATDQLGNRRVEPVPNASLVVHTVPPHTTTFTSALSRPGGAIALSINAVNGASGYTIYRLPASENFPSLDQVAVVRNLTATTYSDTPPTDGTWRYTVSSLDTWGNESALSGDIVAVSDRLPPSDPRDLALSREGKSVRLRWGAPDASPTDIFRIFRDTAPITLLEGRTPAGPDVAATTTLDKPPVDGTYFYAVATVDRAGNLSDLATAGSIAFDDAPPAITVGGVTDGEVTRDNVTPTYSATDGNLASVNATLDNVDFASGTTVMSEADHLLVVTASDTNSNTSTKTVHFAIDRTPPVVQIIGVADGETYDHAVTPTVRVTDPHLDTTITTLNGAPFKVDTTLAANGVYTIIATATDLADSSSTTQATFTIDAPPPAPVPLTVTYLTGDKPQLAWAALAGPALVGYNVRRDGLLLTTKPLTTTSLTDNGYTAGTTATYQVTAVDSKGRDGAPATVTLAPLTLVVRSFGRASADGSGNVLTRRYIDDVLVGVENHAASEVTPGTLTAVLSDGGTSVGSANVPKLGPIAAGGSHNEHVALSVGASASATRTLLLELTIPGPAGSRVVLRTTSSLPVRETPLPVEVFSGTLELGGTAQVQVKLFNHGSVPIELLTSQGTGEMSDVEVRLMDAAGSVVSTARLNDRGSAVTLFGGGAYVPIPVGGSYLSATIPLAVPSSIGASGTVQAVVHRAHLSLEGGPDATTSELTGQASAGTSNPPYTATATTARSLYRPGENITITGSAFDSATKHPVPNVPVSVGISVRGFIRRLAATTGADGTYSVVFEPFTSESGHYTIWASHPDVTEPSVQGSFDIPGLTVAPSRATIRMSKGGSFSFPLKLENTGEMALSGFAAFIDGGTGVTGQIDLTSVAGGLAPGRSATVRVTLSAAVGAADTNFTSISLTTAEGAQTSFNAQITLLEAIPALTSEPSYVAVGVHPGDQATATFKITNVGFAPLTGIKLRGPSLPWIALAIPSEVPDLAPGASFDIPIAFRPGAEIAQSDYSDAIVIEGTNHPAYTLNIVATVTSSAKGALDLLVRDSEARTVPQATITVTASNVAGLEFKATTDAEGRALVQELSAGIYQYRVEAPGRSTVWDSVAVAPGVTTPLAVRMIVQYVTLDWSVVPVVIEDRYDITVNATFETNAPAPVLTVTPAYFEIDTPPGQSYSGTLRVENHGLVALDDVNISGSALPGSVLTLLVKHVDRLAAKKTMLVPFSVDVLPDAPTSEKSAESRSVQMFGCEVGRIDAQGDYECADKISAHTGASSSYRWRVPFVSCPVPVWAGGGGAPGSTGSGTGGSPPTTTTLKRCGCDVVFGKLSTRACDDGTYDYTGLTACFSALRVGPDRFCEGAPFFVFGNVFVAENDRDKLRWELRDPAVPAAVVDSGKLALLTVLGRGLARTDRSLTPAPGWYELVFYCDQNGSGKWEPGEAISDPEYYRVGEMVTKWVDQVCVHDSVPADSPLRDIDRLLQKGSERLQTKNRPDDLRVCVRIQSAGRCATWNDPAIPAAADPVRAVLDDPTKRPRTIYVVPGSDWCARNGSFGTTRRAPGSAWASDWTTVIPACADAVSMTPTHEMGHASGCDCYPHPGPAWNIMAGGSDAVFGVSIEQRQGVPASQPNEVCYYECDPRISSASDCRLACAAKP